MFALLAPLASLTGWEVSALKRRLLRLVVVWGIIATLGTVAAVSLLIAANAALASAFGPVVAPLIIAAAALAIGLVVFLVFHLRESAEARRRAEKRHDAEIAAVVTSAAIAALPMLTPALKRLGLPLGGAALAAWSLYNARRDRSDE